VAQDIEGAALCSPAPREKRFCLYIFLRISAVFFGKYHKGTKNQEKPMRAEALLRSFEESRARRWRYSCRKTVFRFL
jgi:hypothetical protein